MYYKFYINLHSLIRSKDVDLINIEAFFHKMKFTNLSFVI